MNLKRFALVLTAAAALLVGSNAAQAQKSAVGVVDVRKIFDSSKEWIQVKAELQTMADHVKQEDQRRQQKLQDLQQDVGLINKSDPNYERKLEELERAALDRNVWIAYQQAKLGREEVVRMEGLYNKMVDTIKRISETGGFKVVLLKEENLRIIVPGEQITKREQIWEKVTNRKVVWAADDVDLTDQVKQKMDNEFAAGSSK